MKLKVQLSIVFLSTVFFATAAAKFSNAAPPSASISYNSPFCTGSGLASVNFTGTTGGTFSATPASLSINTITGTVDPSASLPGVYTVTYTIPAGIDPAFTTTTMVTIVEEPYSGVDGTISVCEGSIATIDLYSVISGEQSGGSWVRVYGTGGTFNATAGTFTPDFGATVSQFMYTVNTSGPCMGQGSTATIMINAMEYPYFAQIAPICPGSTPPILPAISPNGIIGTWSPSVIDNQSSGTYIFTPDAGQCATLQTMLVTVSMTQPTFSFSSYNLCAGNIPVLPTTSNNGITGTWNPATITTTGVYTFTPDAGQCATTKVETFVVNTMPTANISQNVTICEGNSATITFTGTPNTIVTYDIDGGANQTIILNATGMAVITTPVLNGGTSMIYCLISATTAVGSCTMILTGCAVITVMPQVSIAPIANVFSCQAYVLPPLTVGNYYTNFSGTGTMLHAGDEITTTQLIYVYASNGCSSDEESFWVNVYHPVVITPMPDITACGYYNLPVNNEAAYYTEPHGAGMLISPGNIYTSQTIYLYAATASMPSCVSEDAFQVTIIPAVSPVITSENNVDYIYVDGTTVVQPLLLNAEVTGNYSYQWLESNAVIAGATSSTFLVNAHIDGSWHNYSVRVTNNDTKCVTESAVFQVFETPVPAPIGSPNQTFTFGQTLANIVVIGSNIQWYSSALNRNALSVPLPLNTILTNGTTYFASQTVNGHESADRFGVTVQLSLAASTFDFHDLKYSPNPVKNILSIQSKETIQTIAVYTILGQEVYHQKVNAIESQLDLSALKPGNYFLEMESDAKKQMIRIIKE